MSKNIVRALKRKIPLRARIVIGPIVAYVFYFLYTHIRRNPFRPHILSIEETLDLIIRESLSVVRFGDGEISLMDNTELSFQDKDPQLIEKLKTILQSNHKGLLICVLNVWEGKVDDLADHVYWFELHHVLKHHQIWETSLSPHQVYGDAFITRPYLTIKDKSRSQTIFNKVRSLWENKDVVLIEGEKSRLGINNDLFINTRSLKRILCPAENAFSYYDQIKNEASKVSKDTLILLSLGPTAKPLAYDMFLSGYRVIDIGHIDMEYEMYLRKETKLVKVKYKYFNEIGERSPEDCDDPDYHSQIIARIA